MSVPSRLCLLVLRVYLLTFANALSCVWAFIQTISNVQVFVEQTSRAFLFFETGDPPRCISWVSGLWGHGCLTFWNCDVVMKLWTLSTFFSLAECALLTKFFWPKWEKHAIFQKLLLFKKNNSTNHGTSLDQWIVSSCQVFPSTLWTPGINLRLSDLKKSTFTHWLICVASSFLSDSNSTTWSENLTGWGQYVLCRGGSQLGHSQPRAAWDSLPHRAACVALGKCHCFNYGTGLLSGEQSDSNFAFCFLMVLAT